MNVDYLTDFNKRLDKFTSGYNRYSVFLDFTRIAAITLSNQLTIFRNDLEQEYLFCVEKILKMRI